MQLRTDIRRGHPRFATTRWAVILPLVLGACASGGGSDIPTIPSINASPTNARHPGKFVWYDLVTDDVEGAKRFYGELFDWSFSGLDGGDAVTMARLNGRDVATIVALDETRAEVEDAAWFSSVSVDDVDDASTRARRGGSIDVEPRDLPNRGRYSVVHDPLGAALVLLRTSDGDPVDRDDFEPGEFLWTELWTTDARGAVAYYEAVLGYSAEFMGVEPRPFFLLSRDGEVRAGVGELPPDDDARSAWLPYIAVSDAQAVADRVEDLGGEVLVAPDAMIRGSAAVFADPAGAIFAIQEWPVPDEPEGREEDRR